MADTRSHAGGGRGSPSMESPSGSASDDASAALLESAVREPSARASGRRSGRVPQVKSIDGAARAYDELLQRRHQLIQRAAERRKRRAAADAEAERMRQSRNADALALATTYAQDWETEHRDESTYELLYRKSNFQKSVEAAMRQHRSKQWSNGSPGGPSSVNRPASTLNDEAAALRGTNRDTNRPSERYEPDWGDDKENQRASNKAGRVRRERGVDGRRPLSRSSDTASASAATHSGRRDAAGGSHVAESDSDGGADSASAHQPPPVVPVAPTPATRPGSTPAEDPSAAPSTGQQSGARETSTPIASSDESTPPPELPPRGQRGETSGLEGGNGGNAAAAANSAGGGARDATSPFVPTAPVVSPPLGQPQVWDPDGLSSASADVSLDEGNEETGDGPAGSTQPGAQRGDGASASQARQEALARKAQRKATDAAKRVTSEKDTASTSRVATPRGSPQPSRLEPHHRSSPLTPRSRSTNSSLHTSRITPAEEEKMREYSKKYRQISKELNDTIKAIENGDQSRQALLAKLLNTVHTLNDPDIRIIQAKLTVEEQENAVADANHALQESIAAVESGHGSQREVIENLQRTIMLLASKDQENAEFLALVAAEASPTLSGSRMHSPQPSHTRSRQAESPVKRRVREVRLRRSGEQKTFDFALARGHGGEAGVTVYVADVGRFARTAGLRVNDQLLSINGVPLPTGVTKTDVMAQLVGKDVVDVTVVNNPAFSSTDPHEYEVVSEVLGTDPPNAAYTSDLHSGTHSLARPIPTVTEHDESDGSNVDEAGARAQGDRAAEAIENVFSPGRTAVSTVDRTLRATPSQSLAIDAPPSPRRDGSPRKHVAGSPRSHAAEDAARKREARKAAKAQGGSSPGRGPIHWEAGPLGQKPHDQGEGEGQSHAGVTPIPTLGGARPDEPGEEMEQTQDFANAVRSASLSKGGQEFPDTEMAAPASSLEEEGSQQRARVTAAAAAAGPTLESRPAANPGYLRVDPLVTAPPVVTGRLDASDSDEASDLDSSDDDAEATENGGSESLSANVPPASNLPAAAGPGGLDLHAVPASRPHDGGAAAADPETGVGGGRPPICPTAEINSGTEQLRELAAAVVSRVADGKWQLMGQAPDANPFDKHRLAEVAGNPLMAADDRDFAEDDVPTLVNKMVSLVVRTARLFADEDTTYDTSPFVCTHDVEEARIASPQTELHQSFCDQVAFNFGDALRAVHENPADSVLLPSSTAVAAGALLASEGVAAVTAAITPTVFRDRPREGIALIAEATAAGGCYDALEEARASGREANVGGFTVRLLRVVLQSPTLLHRLLKAKPTDFSRDDAASLVTVSRHLGTSGQLMEACARVEISESQSDATLLRGATPPVRCMLAMLNQTGRVWLHNIFDGLLQRVVDDVQFFDYEGILAQRNAPKFERKCQRATATFLQQFYSRLGRSFADMPAAVRAVCFYLRREVALYYPTCEERVLRSLIFLQFVQPALTDPVRYGLLSQDACTVGVQRGCMQLSRRMNLVTFNDAKTLSEAQVAERHVYASIINSNQGHITHFLDAISTFPGDDAEEGAALAALSEPPLDAPPMEPAVAQLETLLSFGQRALTNAVPNDGEQVPGDPGHFLFRCLFRETVGQRQLDHAKTRLSSRRIHSIKHVNRTLMQKASGRKSKKPWFTLADVPPGGTVGPNTLRTTTSSVRATTTLPRAVGGAGAEPEAGGSSGEGTSSGVASDATPPIGSSTVILPPPASPHPQPAAATKLSKKEKKAEKKAAKKAAKEAAKEAKASGKKVRGATTAIETAADESDARICCGASNHSHSSEDSGPKSSAPTQSTHPRDDAAAAAAEGEAPARPARRDERPDDAMIVISVERCTNLQPARGDTEAVSAYVHYEFEELEISTPTVPSSNNPTFGTTKSFEMPWTESNREKVKSLAIAFVVLDDDAADEGFCVGMAGVELAPLAAGERIDDAYPVLANDDVTVMGLIHVKIGWEVPIEVVDEGGAPPQRESQAAVVHDLSETPC